MLLNINKLNKTFGDLHVLKDINLTVNEGEFVAILGPSGSGKSTLFQLIGGNQIPDQGEIFLNDELINGKKGFISYMPQQPSLFPWRTVLENVVLAAELKGKPNYEEAKQWLAKVGLADFENSYPIELSGGMKQRVSFIRALLSKQNLLCLDEPFSALDEFTRLKMQKWLLSVWEENRKSILFITHSIEEAIFLADRIYILSKRPAEIKAEIKVPFSRPRDERLLESSEFFTLKQEIFQYIREEITE
ncbi:ABC transporter ATP-binding protein [Ureibacillus acetophenoni]|uniref:ABC-type nitrate/sulfonate/bicarbonate transport system ATPase subunit n=1 Tax=Ureibacillus acetophenoni TaxID=614649 RepID=A0A285UDB4_9BACL|nr:ABC transporter ATP-binding protein [Ureibacillus acetophenoni]UQM69632.1 nitrilase [Lysinibacillus sphaericus]SOC39733.1 ABC-type nitrate/sulfonate/bicarbonate transport system ATPase subunit [Ureibacillus acetophenoni]